MIDLIILAVTEAENAANVRTGRNIAFAAIVIGGVIWAVVKANKGKNQDGDK